MRIWDDFLDSLATRGGSIFMLSFFFFILGALMYHVLHHGDNDQVATVIISTFSGFGGALLTALTSQARQRPAGDEANGKGAAAAPTSAQPEPPAAGGRPA